MDILELEDILTTALPSGFTIDTDDNGQIIIMTGLMENEDGDLISSNDEEEVEEDPDFESLDGLEDEDEDD